MAKISIHLNIRLNVPFPRREKISAGSLILKFFLQLFPHVFLSSNLHLIQTKKPINQYLFFYDNIYYSYSNRSFIMFHLLYLFRHLIYFITRHINATRQEAKVAKKRWMRCVLKMKKKTGHDKSGGIKKNIERKTLLSWEYEQVGKYIRVARSLRNYQNGMNMLKRSCSYHALTVLLTIALPHDPDRSFNVAYNKAWWPYRKILNHFCVLQITKLDLDPC